MDIRAAQQILLQKKIPMKRNYQERQDSDEELQDNEETKQMQPPHKRLQHAQSEIFQDDILTIQNNAVTIAEQTKLLPIFKHKNQILRKLEKHRVLIVSGDTGCGKTTQVPKYILEQANFKKQECKIICTQPRRLAAINISRRIASEMGERIGQTIGYQVGMQSRRTKGVTKVTFMTTGIFLQRLVNNPESIKKCTHIILDEVHERDLDIDFSLVVLKHLLVKLDEGFNFKLVLMSATFNIELFSNYFSKTSIREIEQVKVYVGVEEQLKKQEEAKKIKDEEAWGPCKPEMWKNSNDSTKSMEDDDWVDTDMNLKNNMMPVEKQKDPAEVIEINARLYEVKEFYMDKIIQNLRSDQNIKLTSQDKELIADALTISDSNKPQVKEGTMRIASLMICDVIEKCNMFQDGTEEKKGILIFLPGLFEIFEFMDFINEWYDPQWVRNNIELIPLHSSLCEEEQDKAFKSVERMQGRRKVIIATNIAESSITIPDIKYVIDFMLTKELYYDPQTKSESLNLSWVSKASSKQRAGRAGRVSDGIVFRLCTEKFYKNSIPEYPKPEMQRCPLEKLILQIKLWNKYEPEEILGRSIQPPEYRDICNAIKNLQQTGALTIPPPYKREGEENKSSITALGKIFVNLPCDLKITRLFLFGMALKCMSQAIIMGCIHQQQRSIFRSNRFLDPVNLTKLQCTYDENRDSDSIMLLRVFNEWIHKFHPQLKHKNEALVKQPEQRYGGPQNRQLDHRRIRFSRISQQERQWCRDRNLDLTILKEVATTVEEIRFRFQKIGISEKCLNSKVYAQIKIINFYSKLRDDNPDAILILKCCIGGAFYSKYVKAAYKNEDVLSKMVTSQLFEGDEAKTSLILSKMSDYITEDHLKQFFEAKFKVPVKEIKVSVDKPILVFGKEILEKGFIKACFKLGLRNRISRYRKLQDEEFKDETKFRSNIFSEKKNFAKDVLFSYNEIKEMLENEEIKRPCYLYELRFETMNQESYVDFDQDSINNFTFEIDPKQLRHVTYACQEYHDKGGRFVCRNSTRLPSIPMVDALFCLVYAPVIQVRADAKKVYFSKVICDGGEMIIHLTHILTHSDLEIIQKIRTMLNETLCNEDNLKQAHLAQVDFLMKNLLKINRLPIPVYEKLQDLRDEEELIERKSKQKKSIEEIINEQDNFFLQSSLLGQDNGQGYDELEMNDNENDEEEHTLNQEEQETLKKRQTRYEEECLKGYFLQPIYVQKLKKKIYLHIEGMKAMQEEFRQRIIKKRDIIKRMKLKLRENQLREVTLICDRCYYDISLLKTMEFISTEYHYAKCVFGSLKKIEIQDALNNPLFEQDREFVELFLEKFKEEDELRLKSKPNEKIYYAFCVCRNNHVVGIVKNQKYLITDISQVKLMFPACKYESWDERFWHSGYIAAFAYEKKTLAVRASQCHKRGFNNDFDQVPHIICELCNLTCLGPDEFVAHCVQNQKHKDLEAKFSSDIFDFLFETANEVKQAI